MLSQPIPNHALAMPVAELKPALTGLGKLINRKGAAILQMIHIERNADGWIKLTSTDLDHFATVRLEQPSKGNPIAMLVAYDELQSLIKACARNEVIYVSAAPENSAGKPTVLAQFHLAKHVGASSLPSLPVTEYPVIPKLSGKSIPFPDHVRSSLHQAMACASTDATRYVLQGACIDTSKANGHYLVGTDGRHLYSSNSFQLSLKTSIIIPKHKFLGWREFNLDGEWQLKSAEPPTGTAGSAYIQLSSRRWTFLSKLIEGNYPAWQQVVPDMKQAACSITLHPDGLDELIRDIELMPCHDEKHMTIGLQWRNKRLHLLSKDNRDTEWRHYTVEKVLGQGRDVIVYCNRSYLLKALSFGLNTLQLIDGITPIRLSNGGRQMIVMPVRVEAAERASLPDKSILQPVVPQPSRSAVITPEQEGKESAPQPKKPADVFDVTLHQLNGLREQLRHSFGVVAELTVSVRQLRSSQRSTVRDLHSYSQHLRHLQKVSMD